VTREALARDAAAIIREEGWSGLTMEKLAIRGGMAKGTVYNYFRDKGEIIRFLIRQNEDRMGQKMSALNLDEREPLEALRDALRVLIEDLYGNRQFISAMIRSEEGAAGPGKGPCAIAKEDRPLWKIRAILLSIITRGNVRGTFRPFDPGLMEAFVHAVIMGVFWQILVTPLEMDGASLVRVVTELILKGLCGDKEPKAPEMPAANPEDPETTTENASPAWIAANYARELLQLPKAGDGG
jgi:AcrR family transcriptional regulator